MSKKNVKAQSTGQSHSPKNGDIVNGKVYARKFAFKRDDKYQLIDKAYNPTYKPYLKEIVDMLLRRVEKNEKTQPSYRYEVVNYLIVKERNFQKKNNGTLKSPIKKFNPLFLGLTCKPEKQEKIRKSKTSCNVPIKIKKVKNLIIVNC